MSFLFPATRVARVSKSVHNGKIRRGTLLCQAEDGVAPMVAYKKSGDHARTFAGIATDDSYEGYVQYSWSGLLITASDVPHHVHVLEPGTQLYLGFDGGFSTMLELRKAKKAAERDEGGPVAVRLIRLGYLTEIREIVYLPQDLGLLAGNGV